MSFLPNAGITSNPRDDAAPVAVLRGILASPSCSDSAHTTPFSCTRWCPCPRACRCPTRESPCRDPHPAPRDQCSQRWGRGAARSQQPGTSGRSPDPSCSCSKPKPRLSPVEMTQQDQGLGCRRAPLLATESRWGAQAGEPDAAFTVHGLLRNTGSFTRCARSRSTHPALGIAFSGEARGKKVREFCCVQHCAEHRSRSSYGPLHRGRSLLAVSQAPLGHPSVTDLALAQGPCHRPCCWPPAPASALVLLVFLLAFSLLARHEIWNIAAWDICLRCVLVNLWVPNKAESVQ